MRSWPRRAQAVRQHCNFHAPVRLRACAMAPEPAGANRTHARVACIGGIGVTRRWAAHSLRHVAELAARARHAQSCLRAQPRGSVHGAHYLPALRFQQCHAEHMPQRFRCSFRLLALTPVERSTVHQLAALPRHRCPGAMTAWTCTGTDQARLAVAPEVACHRSQATGAPVAAAVPVLGRARLHSAAPTASAKLRGEQRRRSRD